MWGVGWGGDRPSSAGPRGRQSKVKCGWGQWGGHGVNGGRHE